MYQHVAAYAGDPILSLVETFQRDPRSHKINLSIGIYFDNAGKMVLPQSVAEAEHRVGRAVKSYLPMEGDAGFRAEVAKLILGESHRALLDNRVAVVQTLGGSGALKLGADFVHQWFPQAQAYVSDPTWDNHRGIFEGAGLSVHHYPYYDPATIGVRFDALCAFLRDLPQHSVVLLHPCCHNPTGVDLSPQQWDTVLTIIQERGLIPFMDMAYQGFADDFERDAYAIRRAADWDLPLLVSYSFSKNMSLYGQRVGALLVLAPNEHEAQLVLGQLKFGVRRIYSSPPAQGGLTAYHVLANPELSAQWRKEVAEMRDRIHHMRQQLHAKLTAKLPEKSFDYFVKQRGMFSYTGLTQAQVQRLRDEFAVYMLDSGRMCVAGLNDDNIDAVSHAMAAVFTE